MTYLLAGIIVIWLCGLLFLVGQYLNDIRVVLNNLAPDAHHASSRCTRRVQRLAADHSAIAQIILDQTRQPAAPPRFWIQ
jgi:hypothetical protein